MFCQDLKSIVILCAYHMESLPADHVMTITSASQGMYNDVRFMIMKPKGLVKFTFDRRHLTCRHMTRLIVSLD